MSHLGGHLNVTHTDEGALRWLKSIGVDSLLDVGCSVGWQIGEALKLGIDAWGFDGDYSLTNNFHTKHLNRIFFNDLTKTAMKFPVAFDGVWCVEVAEHIEEKFTPHLLQTLSNALCQNGILVFTANEGPGVHHVNRKPPTWWKEQLEKYELFFDASMTSTLKVESTMKREFIRNTGMVFRKR